MTAAPVSQRSVEDSRVLDESRGLLRIRTAFLLQLANPLRTDIWLDGPVTAADVLSTEGPATGWCSGHGRAGWQHEPLARVPCRDCDVERIRWFLVHGVPEDDPYPIAVDVGFGFYVPEWLVVDGNHRLAAAALGGLPTLTVEVVGDWDRGVELLVAERDPHGVFV